MHKINTLKISLDYLYHIHIGKHCDNIQQYIACTGLHEYETVSKTCTKCNAEPPGGVTRLIVDRRVTARPLNYNSKLLWYTTYIMLLA